MKLLLVIIFSLSLSLSLLFATPSEMPIIGRYFRRLEEKLKSN